MRESKAILLSALWERELEDIYPFNSCRERLVENRFLSVASQIIRSGVLDLKPDLSDTKILSFERCSFQGWKFY